MRARLAHQVLRHDRARRPQLHRVHGPVQAVLAQERPASAHLRQGWGTAPDPLQDQVVSAHHGECHLCVGCSTTPTLVFWVSRFSDRLSIRDGDVVFFGGFSR